MILTVRTTTGRENVAIDSVSTRIKSQEIPIRSLFHPEELRGYIFIEGEREDIDVATKGIRHVRGIIEREVPIKEIERFLVPEKMDIKVESDDIVEIISGPFKGEQAKVTRVDESKKEITTELLEAAIPIPLTISINSVRIHEKGKSKE